jgi:hypothetical protein
MIYSPFSKYADSSEAVVAPGAVIDAEGLVLVRAKSAQAAGVMPSTGGTDELFAGFSIAGTSAAPFMEGFTNKIETFIVPATGKVTLQFTPIPNQTFVFDASTVTSVTPVTVVGKQVTGLPIGDEVHVTYKYAMSVVQARSRQGDVQPGGYSGAYIGQIGLLKRGLVYTSEFDASKNWAAATSVTAAAGGLVSDQTGTGIAIPAQIVALPTTEVTFLGLEFSAI